MWPQQLLRRAPGKDHTQEGQPSDMGLSLSRGAGGGDAASDLLSNGQVGQSPPSLFMSTLRKSSSQESGLREG